MSSYAAFALLLLSGIHAQSTSQTCTLTASGGDDSPNIAKAFASCSTVLVPQDQNLLIGTKLNTTGLVGTHIRLLGTFTLKDDVNYWRDNAFNVSYQENSVAWMFGGKNVVLDGEGTGTLFGNGQTFYDARIANDTLRPPHFFLPYLSDNIIIRNLNIRQSPRWNVLIHSSTNVIMHHINISARSNTWALGREANRETDGIDMYNSNQIVLHDLHIDVGDDCVSFKPNVTDVFVNNVWCNGTHGVSVGSLGEYDGVKDVVSNIYVNNVTIQLSQNGARVKTWGGANRGYGYVDQIVFSNFKHIQNDSPITIDNCYKTDADACLADPSLMTISNVYFNNQIGTTSGKFGTNAATLVCSVGKCSNIFLNNIALTAPEACGAASYVNSHVNIQGNAAYQFVSDGPTYGAGGILVNNSTAPGVTCANGQVIEDTPTSTTTSASASATASVST